MSEPVDDPGRLETASSRTRLVIVPNLGDSPYPANRSFAGLVITLAVIVGVVLGLVATNLTLGY